MSSSRVMGTCALLGQAVGTAAAIAIKERLSPRGVYEKKLSLLRRTLMDDDSYLPFQTREIPEISRNAMLTGCENVETLRDGFDRPVGEIDHGCRMEKGTCIEYRFPAPVRVSGARIIWDSDLNRTDQPEVQGTRFSHNMMCNKPLNFGDFHVPGSMVRAYRLEGVKEDGSVQLLHAAANNYQRLNQIPISGAYRAIRLIPEETWGSRDVHLFSFEVY